CARVFFQAEDGIRDRNVTGVQTCALPICGAEGVHCFGDAETGLGVAIKVEDGNGRATSVAAMDVLRQLKIGTQATRKKLAKYAETPVTNARKETIGIIKPAFKLNTIQDL